MRVEPSPDTTSHPPSCGSTTHSRPVCTASTVCRVPGRNGLVAGLVPVVAPAPKRPLWASQHNPGAIGGVRSLINARGFSLCSGRGAAAKLPGDNPTQA